MRRSCLVLGMLVLAAIWLGPLLSAWRESFLAHMLAHMGVVAVAAPLIAIGAAGSLSRRLAGGPASLPIVASVVELGVVWGWHAPALRTLAERSIFWGAAEQGSFLAAGLLFWWAATGERGSDTPARAAAGTLGLLFTSMHMTLLGALLALAPRPLYGGGAVTCLGLALTAEQDQHLGGVVMLGIGAAVYLAAGLARLRRALAPDGTSAGALR